MRFLILLLISVVCTFAAPHAFAADDAASTGGDAVTFAPDDWPWWRGPTHDGVAPAGQSPPTMWSATRNIVWRANVPGRGHASPTVVGDQVFLPIADHERGVQAVRCYDRKSGELRWESVVHEGGLMSGNRKASQASPSVACDGERLFINFLNGGAVYTTALDRKGKQLWQTKISDYVVHQGYGSSPLVHKSLVIVSADNKGGGAIAGLKRATGEVVWRHDRPKLPNYSSPVVLNAAGREQLIFIGCDLVSSFDPMTGAKLWEHEGATTECVTTTLTDGTHIYTTGGYPKNHVAAVRADGSGKVVWENSTRVYVPSMLLRGGYIYAVSDPGTAVCWKADTGKRMWEERLQGAFTASPVLVGEHIYAVTEKGDTFVFKATPQRFELVAQNKLGDEVLATPAICGGRIYMRVAEMRDGRRQEVLYCIGEGAE